MRSRDSIAAAGAPVKTLFVLMLRDLFRGNAIWIMLLLICPVLGYGFVQAVSIYGTTSRSALHVPELARSLSPFDGVLVPTLGAFYIGMTFLFPFVVIRLLSREKSTGTLKLLVQSPYSDGALITVKLLASIVGWVIAFIPCVCALLLWVAQGGHLGSWETANLLLGHLLYGVLTATIAIAAASITGSAATAAIIALAFTIGSWILDFAAAGRVGFLGKVSGASLTAVLRTFEAGVFSVRTVLGSLVAVIGFAFVAVIWLPPGRTLRSKLLKTISVAAVAGSCIGLTAFVRFSIDVTEDQRNSFPEADERALRTLREPLRIVVHLTPEDPRFYDLNRSVLTKLERVVRHVRVEVAAPSSLDSYTRTDDDRYGEITYVYGGRSTTSRSTSPEEVLPLIYSLGGIETPNSGEENTYPGYPLAAATRAASILFYMVLPAVSAGLWWHTRRGSYARSTVTLRTTQPQEEKCKSARC